MRPFWTISAAGFAATAITFGPARIGFGLFLSEFEVPFGISTGMAGVISSLGFLGTLIGLTAAYATLARHGPRLAVLLGLGLAIAGTGLVAAAPSLPVLTFGIVLAMTSAGFAWSPFNNIVHRRIADPSRPAALSIISTGTSLGIAAAGATALLVSVSGLPWRITWAAYALAGALAFAVNLPALSAPCDRPDQPATHQPWRLMWHPSALPLYGVALSFGITTAIYVSFAANRIEQAGGVPLVPSGTSSALTFLALGVFGLTGLSTERAKALLGLSGLLRVLLTGSALSLALVALVPTSLPGMLLSTALQGSFVMMTSAVLAFWSDRLFPTVPARSFTAALIVVSLGSVLGPAAAGALSDAFGPQAMFLAAAAISLATVAVVLPRHVQERAPPV